MKNYIRQERYGRIRKESVFKDMMADGFAIGFVMMLPSRLGMLADCL